MPRRVRRQCARLPSIPHTRVGLPFASLFMIDDVWHDQKVLFMGAAQAEHPLELGMMEPHGALMSPGD